MRVLFLFYTQSEGGAPGYLSRRGEEAAFNLAETIAQFLTETIALDLMTGFAARAKSLEEDLRWKLFRNQESLSQALASSLTLFKEVLLLSGATIRSIKTTEPLAEQLGLPVCVDERLDRSEQENKSGSTLKTALEEHVLWLKEVKDRPKVVLVGTTASALLEWLEDHFEQEKLKSMEETLLETTSQGELPTVFACGVNFSPDNSISWIFD